ncbi:N-acetylneuraminate epimerase [Posidoniimonas polymericola]|uniref:N-acetylneuraminate epimerase n=1 Tax=Posidoniimonas polymericola TaxID=2528002 RepID=A0A5C5YPY0_9BACT|nr:hypothetical protein [Posidoniimonas polymericola]TWT76966.1 N-acetylneuraminate epimerase [Posidoniimonas polymericola]
MVTHAATACLLLTLLTAPASAHFAWLSANEDGHAVLFFSEGIGERAYRLPECVVTAEVMRGVGASAEAVKMERVEEDGLNGMVSVEPVSAEARLTSSIEYGVYHGTMLRYEVNRTPLADEQPTASGDAGETIAALPWRDGETLRVLATFQGEPLPGAEVTLTDSTGDPTTTKTNKHGVAKFVGLAAGEVGLLVGHTVKDAAGEYQGDAYTSESYYLTLTTNYQPQAEKMQAASAYPELPTPVASFGAVAADGWVYVYSGHTGTEHEHSSDNLSQHFCRLKLDGGQAWESLPMQTTLQGLPLVEHGGKVYRVGGVHSRNAAGETEDMHSTDEFACFDPSSGEWTALQPLPTPRSSHDAVVIGDSLYVVGGWQLSGESPGEWSTDALRYEFDHPEQGWQAIAEPPFHRRALAASHLDGKLVVLGGMLQDEGVTNRVDAYDPATDAWSELPKLPGKGISGFGVSAWNLDGVVYASGMQGEVYALAPGASEWKSVGKLADPRFFHRLVPADGQSLLVVAGASAENGHVGTLERVEVRGN